MSAKLTDNSDEADAAHNANRHVKAWVLDLLCQSADAVESTAAYHSPTQDSTAQHRSASARVHHPDHAAVRIAV